MRFLPTARSVLKVCGSSPKFCAVMRRSWTVSYTHLDVYKRQVYEAVVHGNLKEDDGTVDAPIGRHPTDRKKMAVTERNSRNAVTHYHVLTRYTGFTHVRLKLETGRTHQIRVHMAYLGHPVAGDLVYGPKKPAPGLDGQCLHARTVSYTHLSGKADGRTLLCRILSPAGLYCCSGTGCEQGKVGILDFFWHGFFEPCGDPGAGTAGERGEQTFHSGKRPLYSQRRRPCDQEGTAGNYGTKIYLNKGVFLCLP